MPKKVRCQSKSIFRHATQSNADRELVPASSSNSAVDIRDLEFSLANDVDELRSRSAQAMSSSRDIALVKLIVCSGLYPQLAIGDEHNYYRNSNELVFHTRGSLPPLTFLFFYFCLFFGLG